MSARVWDRLRPNIMPRAYGSLIGVRSPLKNGRTIRPFAPAGLCSAACAIAAKVASSSGRSKISSRNQWVRAPLVASPPMTHQVSGNRNGAAQYCGSIRLSPFTWMKNAVVPYWIIRSPGFNTPTLTASLALSIVPATTGVPTASPVSAAPRARPVPRRRCSRRFRAASRLGRLLASAARSNRGSRGRSKA